MLLNGRATTRGTLFLAVLSVVRKAAAESASLRAAVRVCHRITQIAVARRSRPRVARCGRTAGRVRPGVRERAVRDRAGWHGRSAVEAAVHLTAQPVAVHRRAQRCTTVR